MANQAIALQARAPQTDFMGRAIQQNAQMMNMMSQRRAAERQAAQLAQAMEIARAEEGRAAAAAERQSIADQLDIDSKRATMLKSELGLIQSGDIDAVNAWVQRAKTLLPAWGDFIPPAETIAADRNVQLRIAGTIEQIINKEVATPTSSVQIGKNARGEDVLLDVRSPGFGAPAALEIPQYSMQAPSGASAPPRAPTAFESAFPTSAAPATDAQIDEAARKITQGAGAGELGISAQDFDRASARANQMTAGGGARMQPISMTTGAQMGGQPDMTAVVQDMMSSKQISQSNLQLMREMAGPDKDAQLAQILKANNIQIVPDAQPQMRSAVFRPGEDAAPRMQQVQAIPPNYQPTGRAATATARPAAEPGIYNVPTPVIADVEEAKREPIRRVRERAAAERPPPEETTATERAKAQAQNDVEFLEKYQSDKRTAQEALNLIRLMIGDTNLVNNKLIYKRGGDGPHEGFQDVVGATWRPGYRFIPGTAAADFDKMLEQIKGSAFLTAYERLKGGGPIATVEGEKGTTAVTRLDRNISEREFVRAARELEASIRDAVARADKRYDRLSGRKTPTRRGATVDELVKKYGG